MISSKKAVGLTLSALMLAVVSFGAHAEMDAAQLERLGKDLTPNGAEMAGNKDGTIPAWTGGLSKPPAGWKPEQGYADPFKDEKPILKIDAKNVDQYKDKLSAGLVAMVKKSPTFYLNVYPSHRTFAQPAAIYEATKKQAATAKMNGLSITGYTGPGTAFPVPKSGVEAMFNHSSRFFGSIKTCRDWLPVRASGDYYRVGFCEDNVQGQNMEPRTDNEIFAFFGYYDAPETLVGTIYLVHDPVDFTKGARQAWIYNAGQRRVRRAPDLAYDNIDDGTEGMRTTDDYWGFQGAMDRYDFKLAGKKEMYVPYNAYKQQDPTLKYKDMVDKTSLKSELQRFELHRVWVVEATLKAGMSHVLPKRTYYIDEDSHTIVLADGYDGRGNLWRVYTYPLVQAYDAGVMFQAPFITHDLTNGNYMVTALTNERKQPAYSWGAKGKAADFTVDAIRRRGTR
jgi:hypothetical protein